MVERRTELKRRQHRKKKMRKLKDKLAHAKDGRERDALLHKIHVLSPWWTEPAQSR
jgi:hypothetical protein